MILENFIIFFIVTAFFERQLSFASLKSANQRFIVIADGKIYFCVKFKHEIV